MTDVTQGEQNKIHLNKQTSFQKLLLTEKFETPVLFSYKEALCKPFAGANNKMSRTKFPMCISRLPNKPNKIN